MTGLLSKERKGFVLLEVFTAKLKRLVGCIINHNLGILGNLTIIKVQTTSLRHIRQAQ
jgi:hypothetical protein